MPRLDLRDAVVTLTDISNNYINIKFGDGNIVYTITRNVTYVKRRGYLDSTRPGDEDPVTVKLEGWWTYITGSAPYNIDQFLLQAPAPSSIEQSYVTIDIVFTPHCNTVSPMHYSFTKFRYETIDCDPKSSQAAVSGHANILAPTLV